MSIFIRIGYRYELYCASKAARSTQCTVYCAISRDNGWNFNQNRSAADEIDTINGDNSIVPYTREIFDALTLRYEEPIANNRWDSPLFTLFPDSDLPIDDLFSSLYEKKPPPPNLATQNVMVFYLTLGLIILFFKIFFEIYYIYELSYLCVCVGVLGVDANKMLNLIISIFWFNGLVLHTNRNIIIDRLNSNE